jgi:hypothetical protein
MTNPGTQSPITDFYVASRIEGSSVVGVSLQGFVDLVLGIADREGCFVDEYAVFTDRTSADNFAKRTDLLLSAGLSLRTMTDEQLAEIAPAIHPGELTRTIDSLNRYTD